ncbi:MAG TPA: flagellar basal body P-ring formation chaperone FlgA [Pseudolabrys sp.]|jgi:flagella basal body P-ring formation protein FlgA|nr:flagellar basal body P-ring formation chaperone FlgA [Pseudolabrys sp.]
MIRPLIRMALVMTAMLLVLCTAAAAQTIAALDQPRPKLRAEATVTTDVVRVGDLVDNAGIIANVPIFRAPDLGSTGMVSAERVVEAVREHALIGLDTGGITDVVVTRASRAIPGKAIEAVVSRALASQFALGTPGDIALNFDRGLRTIYVPPSAKGEPHVTRLSYEPRDGRFTAFVEIANMRAASHVLRFTGTATVTVEVAMLTRGLNRGDVIKSADVVTERRPKAELGNDVITSADQIVGRAARNALRAGRPLRSFDLMKPDLVQRNDPVTLVYRVPGIMLTVRGKAIESGTEGDVISVLNEQSKRTVQGVVTGPGHVLVTSSMARIAETVNETASRNAPDRAQ